MRKEILQSLKRDTVSVTDQYGCQCSVEQLIHFIEHTEHLLVREIGRKTFVLANTEFDREAKGFCQSYVVLMSLVNEVSLLPLTSSPRLLKAS